jgi:hypothetical protein
VIPRAVIWPLKSVPAHTLVQMAAAFLERHVTQAAATGRQVLVPIPVMVVVPFPGPRVHGQKELPITIPARVALCLVLPVHSRRQERQSTDVPMEVL